MFIESNSMSTFCAPAERDVSTTKQNVTAGSRFAPAERGESFRGSGFYKHFVPTGRGNSLEGFLLKPQ